MAEIQKSHQREPMRNRSLLAVAGESSFQGLPGGAGFRPSTVSCRVFSKSFTCDIVEDLFVFGGGGLRFTEYGSGSTNNSLVGKRG